MLTALSTLLVAFGLYFGAVDEAFEPESAASSRDTVGLSVSTNLLYDAATQANLALELGLFRHFALNMLSSYCPWNIVKDHSLKALLLQPELRFYFRKGFTGHYVGLEGHAAWYNVSWPSSKVRYQDCDGNTPLFGGGVVYGYKLSFSKHFGMDFEIGGGYTHLVYDCFYNIDNGIRFNTVKRDFWGPTKAGISVYYRF